MPKRIVSVNSRQDPELRLEEEAFTLHMQIPRHVWGPYG